MDSLQTGHFKIASDTGFSFDFPAAGARMALLSPGLLREFPVSAIGRYNDAVILFRPEIMTVVAAHMPLDRYSGPMQSGICIAGEEKRGDLNEGSNGQKKAEDGGNAKSPHRLPPGDAD
jgi:hypothetical protein